MLTAQRRLARKVAARWGFQQACGDWQPNFPKELFVKYAYRAEESPLLDNARMSVNSLLPKFISEIARKQGDRYYMTSSEHANKIFYFFAPRQPVDAFNLTLYIQRDMAVLELGYMPYKLDGMLDLQNMLIEKTVYDPDLAGMALMRIVRKLLARI